MKNRYFIFVFLLGIFAMACSSDPKKKDDESENKPSQNHRDYFDRHFGRIDR